MAKRKTLGGTDVFHIDAATDRLRDAYKHAARISRATDNSDCPKIMQELTNTWGFIRQAEEHANALSLSSQNTERGRELGRNLNRLKNRWKNDWDTVGSQCTLKKRR